MVKAVGSIFSQADGRWIARYLADNKRKTVYGRTKEEAAKKRQQKIDELNKEFFDKEMMKVNDSVSEKVPISKNQIEFTNIYNEVSADEDTFITVREWLTEWLKTNVKPYKSEPTYKGYKIFVNKHIIPAVGGARLKDITPETIDVFFKAIGNESCGGMSPQSMRNMYFMFKSALGCAVKDGLIRYNPMDLVKATKAVRREKKILSHYEEQNLIEKCLASDKIIMHGVLIALSLGLSIGELLALKWTDIDQDKKQVYIRHLQRRVENTQSSVKKKTALCLTETNAVRVIDEISDWLQTPNGETAPYNQESFFDDMEMLKNKSRALNGSVPTTVIACADGSPVDPGYYNRLFKKMLDLAGIERANFDILRNTFAVRLFDKGRSFSDVCKILGFSNESRSVKILMRLSHNPPNVHSGVRA